MLNRIHVAADDLRRRLSPRRDWDGPPVVPTGLHAAVHLVLDRALLDGTIRWEERESLRAILALGANADAAQRAILAETLMELRGMSRPRILARRVP